MEAINPMDYNNTRYADFIANHFTKVKFIKKGKPNEKLNLLQWLESNTTGRFSIDKDVIGFENTGDVTAFQLFYQP